MIYATLDHMTRRFGALELAQLTDIVNMPPSVIDEARVAMVLEDASSTIDGYLGVVYRMPLKGCWRPESGDVPGEWVAPPQLVAICCDLARASLYSTFLPVEHEVSQRRKQALEALQRIADGKAVLACPWGGEPGEVLSATPQTSANLSYSFSTRSVTDEELRGF